MAGTDSSANCLAWLVSRPIVDVDGLARQGPCLHLKPASAEDGFIGEDQVSAFRENAFNSLAKGDDLAIKLFQALCELGRCASY